MMTHEVTRLTATRPARSPWRYWVLLTSGVGAGSGMVPSRPILATQVPVLRLVAQASQDALDSLPATRLPARWATSTDTGDYAPGHRDFARYTTPLFCVAAARTEVQYARRTAALTAAAYVLQHTAPEQDTLPASVTRVARTCGVHFLDQPVAHMAAADLPALFALALLARQDTIAQAILARSATLAPTEAARQQVWLDGLDTLLHAEPARVAAATALLAQWTAQGPSGVALHLEGAARFLTFWRQHFDRARMRDGADALLRLEPDTTQPVATKIALLSGRLAAYRALWQLAAVDHPDSLAAVGRRVVQDLQRPIWDMPGWQQLPLIKWVREFQSMRHDADALRAWATDESQAFSNVRIDSQPMFPLKAAYWIAPTGATARDTVVRPTPGRVSLYVRPVIDCYNDELNAAWGDKTCTPVIDRLTRWQRRYGGQGLQIIVIGYSSWEGALYSGPLAPVAQAEAIGWYVHQFAQLPVPVAVQPLGVTRFPAPDGTLRWNEYGENFDFHINGVENVWSETQAVLTDRAGRVVYLGPDDASILDALLMRLVGRPSTGNASTPPSTAPRSALSTPASAPATGASSPAASSLGATPVVPVTPGTP